MVGAITSPLSHSLSTSSLLLPPRLPLLPPRLSPRLLRLRFDPPLTLLVSCEAAPSEAGCHKWMSPQGWFVFQSLPIAFSAFLLSPLGLYLQILSYILSFLFIFFLSFFFPFFLSLFVSSFLSFFFSIFHPDFFFFFSRTCRA